MDTLKGLLVEQNNAFTAFKKRNDERAEAFEARFKALEAKGSHDPLLEEKVDFANKKVKEISKQMDAIETKINRPGAFTGAGKGAYMDNTKGFDLFLRKGDASELETKSFNMITGGDGGYAVPSQLDAKLNNYLFDANPMRRISTVVKAETADYKVAINTGGLAAGWVAETDARTETGTPSIVQITPPTGELYANPAATQWMLDDAGFDLENWLMTEVQNKFSSMEGGAFITGDGNNKPKGVLAHLSSTEVDGTRAFGTLKHTLAAAAAAITADELIDLSYDLRGVYRVGATWLMNSKTAAFIRKLKDTTTGMYLWQQALTGGQPSMLSGYPVEVDENMPDIAAGSVPIMFGNFRQGYRIVDRTPLRIQRDPYTNKPFVHFYSTKRVSGMVVDSCAIRLLKMAAA